MAEGADRLSAIFCAPGLRGVLDQRQPVLIRECFECAQIARVAAQVHGDDSLRLGRDAALHVCRVKVVSAGARVREDRHALLINHADDRPNVSDRRRDDFVARLDARRRHRDVQCRCAGRARHDVFHRADFFEAFDQQCRLRSFPVEERVLPQHRVQAFALRLAPADGEFRRLLDCLFAAVKGEFWRGL